MREAVSVAAQSSNFNLKNEITDLIPSGADVRVASVDTSELEAFRAALVTVPASKHGLEAITGASCETGAQ